MITVKDRAARRSERIKRSYERHKKIHRLLKEYAADILASDNFRSTKAHIQHGSMTVYSHCMDVARCSLMLNQKLGLHCNKRDLIRGALLHDYFLYDWHDKDYVAVRGRFHGFRHPAVAAANAEREYGLNAVQREIIRKHMWPLAVVPPTCKEAWVVAAADKYCSLRETVGIRKGHGAQRDAGLYEKLRAYGESGSYPCHMPGHKRNPEAGEMARYYDIDITEIDGFDNLHHPQGILQEAQQRANSLYGADETFYLVNGSTVGVLAAVMTAAGRGGELLIARNCHRSVYHAAILQELTLRFCYPDIIGEYGICDGVRADEIGMLMDRYPACRTVVVTSPTYEGIVTDIRAVADAVHARGGILIVDEAHGAHFGLHETVCSGALAGGADLVIHSLHKTLPAMTQTALLHVQGGRVDRERLRGYLTMLQTSSPSYVMMASMDSCIRYMETQGAERFLRLRQEYEDFCRKISGCRYIGVGREQELPPGRYALAGWDIGKLVIYVKNCGLTGRQLYDMLREEYRLQMEMAAGAYVVALMTVMDTREGWQRLADALLAIDDKIKEDTDRGDEALLPVRPVYAQTVMSPAEAFRAAREVTALTEAEGRTAADFVNLYPPGSPILAPGERITGEILAQIGRYLDMGLTVQGILQTGCIAVVADGGTGA